jgi:hypothetical protein
MDFSTILKINIYTLGSCYLKIIEKLNFKKEMLKINFQKDTVDIPLLDP